MMTLAYPTPLSNSAQGLQQSKSSPIKFHQASTNLPSNFPSDIDLEPADSHFPAQDQPARQQRVRDWESGETKEYKLVVLNPSHPAVKKTIFLDHPQIETLLDLHGRKLIFLTKFRPRARYIWWTFLNAILRASWDMKDDEHNLQHRETLKATRYWGTRGRYVKENQLLDFVEEIGHDVKSILDQGISETGEKEPDFEGVAVIANDVIDPSTLRGEDDEDDEEDALEDQEDEENGADDEDY